MVVSMKMTVFWDVMPFSLAEVTDVSEMLVASIIKAMSKLCTRNSISGQAVVRPSSIGSLAINQSSAFSPLVRPRFYLV
jgi:hypothetical protein